MDDVVVGAVDGSFVEDAVSFLVVVVGCTGTAISVVVVVLVVFVVVFVVWTRMKSYAVHPGIIVGATIDGLRSVCV